MFDSNLKTKKESRKSKSGGKRYVQSKLFFPRNHLAKGCTGTGARVLCSRVGINRTKNMNKKCLIIFFLSQTNPSRKRRITSSVPFQSLLSRPDSLHREEREIGTQILGLQNDFF